MAASTLLLLWLFQFIFFDVLYYDRQEAHVKEISADLISYEYGVKNPTAWSNFEDAAKSQNLNVYIFTVGDDDLIESGGQYYFSPETELRIYTPHHKDTFSRAEHLNWPEERINEYISKLKNMGEEKSFTYIEQNNLEESVSDNVIYGGELKGDFGSKKAYFCFIATISKGNYTVTIMQNMLLVVSGIIFVVTILLSLLFSRRIARPINKLAVTANQLAEGDFNVTFKSDSFKEVKQLAYSLNFAKEEMSKTEQMRREFIANVSHDLRTPLTMIKAYAEMIRDLSGRNEEKRTKHCQIIIDESDRLSLLVADIQNLSKLQSGTESFNIKKFDLSELCKTVINRFGIMSEKGYVFVCDCDENSLCLGDYQKIEQVLYNLIGNALNYTGEDKTVTIRCKPVDNGYKVEIIDTGKGIDPEEIDSVWERYYRANQKKRNVVGSGLGLNIVKMILEGHKTQYGVVSEIDKGTSFWFILPAAVGDENK